MSTTAADSDSGDSKYTIVRHYHYQCCTYLCYNSDLDSTITEDVEITICSGI